MMHLAPLAGIETIHTKPIIQLIQMHLAPLAGIETDILRLMMVLDI